MKFFCYESSSSLLNGGNEYCLPPFSSVNEKRGAPGEETMRDE